METQDTALPPGSSLHQQASSQETEARQRKNPRQPFVLALLALYAFLCGLYLLTSSARLGVSDAGSMYAVTRSLFTHGWVDVGECNGPANDVHCIAGVDGRKYAAYGIASSILVLPGFAIGWVGASLLHKDPNLLAAATVVFYNACFTALIPVLLAWWIYRLGYGVRSALLSGLALGLMTPLWFHGVKGLYSEPHFMLFLLLACYLLFEQQGRQRQEALLLSTGAGLCIGIALGTRIYGVIFVPLLLWYLWAGGRVAGQGAGAFLQRAVAFVIPLTACLLAVGWINFARFGNPTRTGYDVEMPTSERFSMPWHEGLWGVLFDGTAGLLWYAPLLLVLPLAWRGFYRWHPREAILTLSCLVVSILFTAKMVTWTAGWSFGPRYQIPMLWCLVLPLAPLFAGIWPEAQPRRRLAMAALTAVLTLSLGVQLLGLCVSMSRYYEMRLRYREQGAPAWWDKSLLLHHAAVLPAVLTYKADRFQQAGTLSDSERNALLESARGSKQNAFNETAYLEQMPNAVNYLLPDFWWIKAKYMGLPNLLTLGAVLLLSFLTTFGGIRLAIHLRTSRLEAPPLMPRSQGGE